MSECPICDRPTEEGDHTLCKLGFRGLVDQRLKEREAEQTNQDR